LQRLLSRLAYLKDTQMDDFSQIIKMLESAKQLAEMNQLPMLVYLIEMAKAEARGHRFELRERKRGESRKVEA
jgi:hypothetical protein